MKITENGIEIELLFDGDGFPIVTIDTQDSFHNNGRPTVEVNLSNGGTSVQIHDMFDSEDLRWSQ
jgi:hypothetical protein